MALLLVLRMIDFNGGLLKHPNIYYMVQLLQLTGFFIGVLASIGNIVSFDANVEKFSETTYRHNDKRASRGGYWGLIEIGGILSSWSLFREEHNDVKRFIVCVVKDYHEEEWIDKYSIPIDTDFMKLMDHHHPVLRIGNGEVIIFHSWEEKTMWALNVKLNQWWEVGNKNLKEKLKICFYGFHVNNKPLPFESIFAIEE